MKTCQNIAMRALLGVSALAAIVGGCHCPPMPTPPLGTHSDEINRRQEAAGVASDFVIYQHEFELDGARLNMGGEDHVRSIAARLQCADSMPVVVERSMTSVRSDSEYQYPVNPNPELDMKRRDIVVKCLGALGVANADQRVVVAPAMAEGFTSTEATRAFNRGLTDSAPGYGGSGGIGFPGTYSNGGNLAGGTGLSSPSGQGVSF